MAQEDQKPSTSEVAESGRYLNQQLGFIDDGIFLQQAGFFNQAIVTQLSDLNATNKAQVRQYGISSSVLLTQSGANNVADIQQDGARNSVDIVELGNSISSRVFQFGVKNKVQQELGNDRTNHTIIQRGYNHEVIDLGFNPNNPGYTIKQRGLVGMTVTIQHR